jgi:DNA-binding MarR family transcriptional regulator
MARVAEGRDARTSVLLELHSADRLVRALVERRMLGQGIRPSFFALLCMIDTHAPITPSGLSAESGLRPTAVRDIVNAMVENGHVQRRPNPADRRSHFLELTPEGKSFVTEAGKALLEIERELDDELGAPVEDLRPELQALRRAARATLARREG